MNGLNKEGDDNPTSEYPCLLNSATDQYAIFRNFHFSITVSKSLLG